MIYQANAYSVGRDIRVLAAPGLVHQVSDWGSGVAMKMGRRSGGCVNLREGGSAALR